MSLTEPDLKPAHRNALRRVARGDVLVLTNRGVTPQAVTRVGPDAHAVILSSPAFSALRGRNLVAFSQGEGPGPWPLTVTAAGRAELDS